MSAADAKSALPVKPFTERQHLIAETLALILYIDSMGHESPQRWRDAMRPLIAELPDDGDLIPTVERKISLLTASKNAVPDTAPRLADLLSASLLMMERPDWERVEMENGERISRAELSKRIRAALRAMGYGNG